MDFFTKNLTIRTKITLLVFGLVFVSISLGAALLIENVHTSVEDELGERVRAIAKTVAQMDDLKENITKPDGWKHIQPIAERVRLATNIDYIVVLDMNRIRFSSPLEDRIGTVFSGGDEGPAFAEFEYVSQAQGVLGPSIRAFVPIMDESNQLGVVVAGVLTPTYGALVTKYKAHIYFALLAALVLGFVGSWFLANHIKNQLFNMEPLEIAHKLEERSAVFHSIKEGIIAVNRDGYVTVFNNHARRLLGYNKCDILDSLHIDNIIPTNLALKVMDTGEPEFNRNLFIRNKLYISSCVPIIVKSKILGSVTTFQDQSDIYLLAEELTGVKKFIEALRAQNHEHMNKMHTIAGLLQLQQYSNAIDYIFSITEEQQVLTGFFTKNFSDYSISGLLLGKHSRGKELGINLMIDPESTLKVLPKHVSPSVFVIIIGNLVENAMDAVLKNPIGQRNIYLYIKDKQNTIHIVVRDNGCGIPEKIRSSVFNQGFTTKTQKNHGIGLALVQEYIKAADGTIDFESEVDIGSTFYVTIPINRV
ncbi:hypothetical protein BHU72_14170 [Desulfuribacillus stibiiarsenatis]|uniref:histidine kinase n=1 Tax=Desulfuribacillus stibiiarsenatis TaxID=1390249 RepID=A0A1E5L8U6_9FIRM|nr:sensor histidine kinase [Desulfuribacillus stibiiarsenatis]OEH86363.1 hypothetical protein BHU72_14170 [Desulfuribacillus stibiiarsenatis]